MAIATKSAAHKILHNSAWIALENVIEAVVLLASSIAVARYLGPQKLGYFSYINFFVSAVTRTSGMGLASATRKYMAEFLAVDRPGVARSVYQLAYKYQLIGALLLTVLALGAEYLFGDPNYRTMAFILILAIVPGVMSWVPAQANNAFEDASKNTISALAYIVTYAVVIVLTIHFHWDLVGVASALFLGRSVEVILRTVPLHRKLRTLPVERLGTDLKVRIRRFCLQSVGIQLLMSVVWDRSEMVFLRYFSGLEHLEQLGFYSVSFGLANNLLMASRTFGGATGITLMVEAGRDPSRVDNIVKNASRYLLLFALPIHLGAAAITRSAVGFAYGPRYLAAVPVLIVASILAIPRAFQEIPETLLRTADRQKQLFIWLSITGALNLVLDFFLIRSFGAVGAAWGNGLSQAFGIMAIWQQARRYYRFSFPIGSAVRLFGASIVMSAVAFFVGRAIAGLPGIVAAIGASVPAYFLMVKLLHGLRASDRQRLAPIGNRLPGKLRGAYLATIAFVTPEESSPLG